MPGILARVEALGQVDHLVLLHAGHSRKARDLGQCARRDCRRDRGYVSVLELDGSAQGLDVGHQSIGRTVSQGDDVNGGTSRVGNRCRGHQEPRNERQRNR